MDNNNYEYQKIKIKESIIIKDEELYFKVSELIILLNNAGSPRAEARARKYEKKFERIDGYLVANYWVMFDFLRLNSKTTKYSFHLNIMRDVLNEIDEDEKNTLETLNKSIKIESKNDLEHPKNSITDSINIKNTKEKELLKIKFGESKYNHLGFDKHGFDRNWIHNITKTEYDPKDFNRIGIHKITGQKYDQNGYDRDDNLIISQEKLKDILENKRVHTSEIQSSEKFLEQENISVKTLKVINVIETEKTTTVLSRRGHTEFKNNLLKLSNSCILCGIEGKEFLIASHIKPWKSSNDFEKLDHNNGFLLCPNHDMLFDKGYITFEDNGTLVFSTELIEKNIKLLGIDKNIKIKVTSKNLKYLKYHRDNIFK